MKVIDLTHTITESMPLFPGTKQPTLTPVHTHSDDGYSETSISMYSHTGTHIDAPAHVVENGKTLDSFSIEQFVGKAVVIDCRSKNDGEFVTISDLEKYGQILKQADFLLFCFGWDKKWGSVEYFGEYPCIDDKVIDYIINNNYKGIGVDVMGIDPIKYDQIKRHKRLFINKEMIVIENMKNLDLCIGGLFTLCSLPLKIKNTDGCPARVAAIIG